MLQSFSVVFSYFIVLERGRKNNILKSRKQQLSLSPILFIVYNERGKKTIHENKHILKLFFIFIIE